MDRAIEFQQPVSAFPFGVIVVRAASNRMLHLRPLVRAILNAVAATKPGEVQHVAA